MTTMMSGDPVYPSRLKFIGTLIRFGQNRYWWSGDENAGTTTHTMNISSLVGPEMHLVETKEKLWSQAETDDEYVYTKKRPINI